MLRKALTASHSLHYSHASQRCAYSTRERQHDPLRVLFCGADDFSIFSLVALDKLRREKPETVESIDVVCRTDKRVGRGLKRMQQVPIKAVAQKLDIPVQQIDTFTGWTPHRPYNIVVAVSFGLLVPPRILGAAKYGGLNVHPSLLPALRGPAPIQWTLLHGLAHSGVTLQTMHPKHFDQGILLAQSQLEHADSYGLKDLTDMLGSVGANVLVKCIKRCTFLLPHTPVSTNVVTSKHVQHAPKLTAEHHHIDWDTWTADKVIRFDDVLGRLWDIVTYGRAVSLRDDDVNVKSKRTIFEGPWQTAEVESMLGTANDLVSAEPGTLVLVRVDYDREQLGITTTDGKIIVPSGATIEGEGKGKGLATLIRALSKHSPKLAL